MDFEKTGWQPRNRLIAMFDILGFSALLGDIGIEGVASRIKEIRRELAFYFRYEARSFMFSDTILVYSARAFQDPEGRPETLQFYDDNHARAFMSFCAELMSRSIEIGLPLRGGIACGPCIIMPSRGIFLGESIVAAYRTEEAQNWVGVAIHESALFLLDRSQSLLSMPVEYPIPWKENRDGANWSLDWPRATHRPVWYRAMLRRQVDAHRGGPHEGRWLHTWSYFESRFALLGPPPTADEPDYRQTLGFLSLRKER